MTSLVISNIIVGLVCLTLGYIFGKIRTRKKYKKDTTNVSGCIQILPTDNISGNLHVILNDFDSWKHKDFVVLRVVHEKFTGYYENIQ